MGVPPWQHPVKGRADAHLARQGCGPHRPSLQPAQLCSLVWGISPSSLGLTCSKGSPGGQVWRPQARAAPQGSQLQAGQGGNWGGHSWWLSWSRLGPELCGLACEHHQPDGRSGRSRNGGVSQVSWAFSAWGHLLTRPAVPSVHFYM